MKTTMNKKGEIYWHVIIMVGVVGLFILFCIGMVVLGSRNLGVIE